MSFSETELKVLKVLLTASKGDGITVKEIVKETGIPEATVRRILYKLEQKGYVTKRVALRVHGGRIYLYKLTMPLEVILGKEQE